MGDRRRYAGPRSIGLVNQAGVLRSRYLASSLTLTRDRLVWFGELTPSEYSDTYEVVIEHDNSKAPIIYVARPRLSLVEGQRLPHVYSLNTLCLHAESSRQMASRLLADTLVPWTSEWLLFYEIWLATGGEWRGSGVHPDSLKIAIGDGEGKQRDKEKDEKLDRLIAALTASYGAAGALDELLYNSRL